MNLILLFPEDFLSNKTRVRLTGRRQQHVLEIHRAQKGDELCVGHVNGPIGRGIIVTLTKACLEMDVRFEHPSPPAVAGTLILALPRPPVMRRTLLAATTLGIKKIYLINSFRVEKTFWKSHVLRDTEILDALTLGLEQARDTWLPEVHLRPKFKPFVEDELPHLMEGSLPLLADPEARRPCPANVRRPVTLVMGPEGGFIPFEIEKFLSLGFKPVHLGERILRVESVVPAFWGRICVPSRARGII